MQVEQHLEKISRSWGRVAIKGDKNNIFVKRKIAEKERINGYRMARTRANYDRVKLKEKYEVIKSHGWYSDLKPNAEQDYISHFIMCIHLEKARK